MSDLHPRLQRKRRRSSTTSPASAPSQDQTAKLDSGFPAPPQSAGEKSGLESRTCVHNMLDTCDAEVEF
jgi:hypothetical protein